MKHRFTAMFCMLLVGVCFLSAGATAGKAYIWHDKDGNVHFSDQPPHSDEVGGDIEERQFKETPRKETAAPETPRSPIEHAVRCTFRLKNKKGGASGFFINDTGLAVTAKHVVQGATYSMKAELPGDKRKYRVRILKKSKRHDLALLQVAVKGSTPYLEIRDPKTLVRGEDLWAIGNPLLVFKETVTKGSFSRMFPEEDWKKEVKMRKLPFKIRGDQIQFSAPVIPGNSGGPVVDKEGKVIGVVSWGYSSAPINFAAPISYIEEDFASYLQ
ncbi:MAG: trypsin-like peptidase domain-containing protein [Deltaproteobacteria bacterium]|nr:trypsin-like peptidase domain-containing protein [Deltaproteobacteria bacterium]